MMKITERNTEKNGGDYQAQALGLIYNMDNYYLIAHSKGAPLNTKNVFRLDRIDQVSLLDIKANAGLLTKDELAAYKSNVFDMYAGSSITAEFECNYKGMNVIYDKFGPGTSFRKVEKGVYSTYLTIQESPTFWGWIFMMGTQIRILSDKLKAIYYDRLKSMIEFIDGCPVEIIKKSKAENM